MFSEWPLWEWFADLRLWQWDSQQQNGKEKNLDAVCFCLLILSLTLQLWGCSLLSAEASCTSRPDRSAAGRRDPGWCLQSHIIALPPAWSPLTPKWGCHFCCSAQMKKLTVRADHAEHPWQHADNLFPGIGLPTGLQTYRHEGSQLKFLLSAQTWRNLIC